jgi:hypothetical protein
LSIDQKYDIRKAQSYQRAKPNHRKSVCFPC